VIVLDEFDKISEMANGDDVLKSHSVQGELLTLIQGKKEAGIDTTQSLWILLGAFAYTDEMKSPPYQITKSDLLKYGFKNELLGRVMKITSTEIPTTEEVLKRIIHHASFVAFIEDLKRDGFDVDFEDEALLEMAICAQNTTFGMRIIPSILSRLQEEIIFSGRRGTILVSKADVTKSK
jgi:ATP-dependent Clp protease ATP-binding subunit ClpX